MSNAVATQYKPLIGHSISELESFAESFDEKPFRGRQLFDWIYRQQVDDFSKMTDLSKTFRERLNKVSVHPLKLLNREESSSKQTKKFLFEVSGRKMIESVLMKEGNRTTVCLSTQVGCAVGCDFCATADNSGTCQNWNSEGSRCDKPEWYDDLWPLWLSVQGSGNSPLDGHALNWGGASCACNSDTTIPNDFWYQGRPIFATPCCQYNGHEDFNG